MNKILLLSIVLLFNCNAPPKENLEKDRMENLYVIDYLKGDIKEITRIQYEVETVFNEINKTKKSGKREYNSYDGGDDTEISSFDKNGNIIYLESLRHNLDGSIEKVVEDYSYDKSSNLTYLQSSKHYSDGSIKKVIKNYEYDENGNKIIEKVYERGDGFSYNDDGSISLNPNFYTTAYIFKYDKHNNVIEKKYIDYYGSNNELVTLHQSYKNTYDNNNLILIEELSHNAVPFTKIKFDSIGRLKSTTKIEYNKSNQLTKRTYLVSERGMNSSNSQEIREYDSSNRLISTLYYNEDKEIQNATKYVYENNIITKMESISRGDTSLYTYKNDSVFNLVSNFNEREKRIFYKNRLVDEHVEQTIDRNKRSINLLGTGNEPKLPKDEYTINYKISYNYEVDDIGNWIKKITLKNDTAIHLIERDIEYY